MPVLPRAAALLLFLTAIPTTSALFVRQTSPSELFGRASTCGDSSYTQCSQSGLPDDFCCPSGETCIALAGNTTALCCPTGGDCTEIEPIPCDLSLEDKSQHPESVVMTTALTGTLAKCGEECCPFGYTCNSSGACDIDSDQDTKPATSSVTSSATSTSTGTSSETIGVTTASGSSASATGTATSSGSGVASATTTSSGSLASSTSSSTAGSGSGSGSSSSGSRSSGPSAAVVAGGVVGAIAGALILGMLAWFCVKKELKRKEAAKGEKDPGMGSRSSSFGNIIHHPVTTSPRGPNGKPPVISKPIVNEEGTLRSDFGRKVSPHAGSFRSMNDEEADYENEFGMVGAVPIRAEDMTGLRSVPHSPPKITTPRAVSSMYAAYDYSNEDNDAYQPPVKMPSARHFGGQDNKVSVGAEGRDVYGSPISDYGGQRITRDPNAGYIDVFADSNSLSPPRMAPGDRLTSFTDMMEGAELGPQRRGEPFLGKK
ncbi:hypothetical protein VP1G_09993 [Cytospora mali]|uniref:Uncharacterized protein n=1 Tax=Cytospora mali TaxID=578113 RepID=A0A194VFS8_CYTMA|nr:hypothetical protein VP1G_09993 [Valsa mali var. pyri (nom. inval.)]